MVLSLIAWEIYDHLINTKKIAYIDMKIVFEEFNMKKELESDFQKKTDGKQKELESISNEIARIEKLRKENARYASGDSLIMLYESFDKLSEQHRSNFYDLKAQYDSQIQQQLGQYLMDFGKNENFDILLTTLDGSTILYGNESMNVTESAIQYINNKYAGN